MIGNVGIPGGTEIDGVEGLKRLDPVFRHHHAVLTEIITAPGEGFDLEREPAVLFRDRVQNLDTGLDDFRPDPVSANGGNSVFTHGLIFSII